MSDEEDAQFEGGEDGHDSESEVEVEEEAVNNGVRRSRGQLLAVPVNFPRQVPPFEPFHHQFLPPGFWLHASDQAGLSRGDAG